MAAKLESIDGPVSVVQGAAARFQAIGTEISPDLTHQIRWKITNGGVSRRVGRGSQRALALDDDPGEVIVSAWLPKQKPVDLTVRIEPSAWPELDHTWSIETSIFPAAVPVALARFRRNEEYTPTFIVGYETPYRQRRGLSLSEGRPYYSPSDWNALANVGHWAFIMYPTAKAEGAGSFVALNTYDAATFTFGFLQFSAKDYNDNLHALLLELLGDAATKADQFVPDLRAVDGELMGRTRRGEWIRLTSPKQKANDDLRRYLKNDVTRLTLTEIEFGARFIYWTRFFREARQHQVQCGLKSIRRKIEHLGGAALDQKSDRAFVWLFDLFNQGAPPTATLTAALASANPEEALKNLKAAQGAMQARRAERIQALIAGSTSLGTKIYDAASKAFKPKE